MASPPAMHPATTEKTFRSYTPAQGATYAQNRGGYHPKLYKLILDHHTSTGGLLATVLDVGCGPGTAIRGLAPYFEHAIGIDPSEGMISTALSLSTSSPPSSSATSSVPPPTSPTTSPAPKHPIRFALSTAESLGADLSPPIPDASIDLITAATAAHWFDMPSFWHAASRVLKPGGSVALWTVGAVGVHPSMPNASAIQSALDAIDEEDLVPFYMPGNLLTRTMYTTLPLPWTISPSVLGEENSLASVFDEASFLRREWGTDIGDSGEESDEFMEQGRLTFDLDMVEKVMGTTSPVQRWREANGEKVGTEEDPARRMRRAIEKGLREGGVMEGEEIVRARLRGVLLIVKKKV